MQRVKYGRGLMDFQADMICLQRQLAVILDENHLLKVKIRRLENDMLKKNNYIDYLHMNAQKSDDRRRMSFENPSGTILKLKRKNDDLREMLLKKEAEDQKRTRAMKTMLLYRQLDYRPLKKSLRKSPRHLNSQSDIVKNIPRRLGSLSDSNTLSKDFYRTRRKNTNDHFKLSHISQTDVDELMNMINILKEQRVQDRNIIHEQNLDISRLSVELNEIKVQQKLERSKSNSACLLHNSSDFVEKNNFVENNKLILPNSIEFEKSRSTYRDVEVDIPTIKHKKTILETVEELSEDDTFTTINSESETNVHVLPKTKTQIEYLIDSEVSSDGEDIYIVDNLKNCLKKKISKLS